ncbi:MAG: hypothetical protein M0041_05790 [Nitrospiraceae bacterium]|nr:hypothetical protein [Nitrospiraceae bacterium]
MLGKPRAGGRNVQEFLLSRGRFLLFDIRAHHVDGAPPQLPGKSLVGPERSSPPCVRETGVVFLPNQSTRDALETVHEGGQRPREGLGPAGEGRLLVG